MASSWSSADEPEHDPDFEDLPDKAPTLDLPTERLALVSIVAGIAGFFLPIVGPVTAIVSGHVARDEIRKSRGRLGGDGLARTGMVLGYVWVALTLTAVLVMVSFTFVMMKREAGVVRVHASGTVTDRESWTERLESNVPTPAPPHKFEVRGTEFWVDRLDSSATPPSVFLDELETPPIPPRATIRFLSPSKVAETIERQKGLELRRILPSSPAAPLPPDDPDAT